MKNGIFALTLAASAVAALVAGEVARNPPPECKAPEGKCACATGAGVGNACTKVAVDMGATTPWTGAEPCSLKVFADDESPLVFTPESLTAVCGCAFRRVGNEVLSDGATPKEVVFSRPNGEPLRFVFADGGSVGRPDPGFGARLDARLRMVDAQGRPCTREPAFYDLCEADGSVRRFLAADGTCERGRLVSAADARGFVTTPADMGVDVVYGPDGVRQFLTPSRLADVAVGASGYAVTVYPVREPPAKDPATGLYPLPDCPPVERVSVEAGADGRRAVVTVVKGGGGPRRYVFDYVRDDWSLTRPSGVEERRDRSVRDSECARVARETYSRGRRLLSRDEYNYVWCDWGFAATNHVEGFGGETRTTSWDYHLSGVGKGQVKTELLHTGLRTEYAYDADDRMVSRRRSGPGMMTEATTYSYAPVDPSDVARPVDARPRTVVRTLDGIECERTYYFYSPLTNIVERAGTQGAAYGGTNVLRTVTAFYPAVAGDVRSGRVRSVRHEDGRLDLYDYALADGVWTETVTHLHEQSPEPVSGRTTRDVTATNRRGEILERKTEAFIGEIWYTVARDLMTYDTTGKRIRTENLAGQATVTDWDCCHKVSETGPDGSTTTWDYDDEGRITATSRLVPLDMTNVTWLTTCYEYDDLGRQVATWQTNYAAQVGLPATRTRYDALGRAIARVDTLGNTSISTYSPDGRTVSIVYPNSSTTVIANSSGGEILSITGSAGIPVFHFAGISQNGVRWSREVHGATEESPRFEKRHVNMLGQIVHVERSGFRGAVLSSINTFDSYGRLVRSAIDGEPSMEFIYDLRGSPVANIRTSASNATQQGSSEWRRVEFGFWFARKDSGIWLVGTNVLTCSDSSIGPFVSSSARQLTGCSAHSPFRACYVDYRGNVTEKALSLSGSVATISTLVPYASNAPQSLSRYGVPIMDISISCVTNAYVYDSLCRRVVRIDGRGNTSRAEYDEFGQVSVFIDALGNRTSYAHDRLGNLAAVTNAMGNATFYEYNLRGQRTLEYGATYPVRCTYDVFGNMTSMTTFRDAGANASTAEGDTTIWRYDEASGVMTNKVYADGKGVAYDYSDDEKLVRRTWARGVTTEYSYDQWNNPSQVAYSDGTPTVTFSYDALGRKRLVKDAAGSTVFTYDSFGALTNETVVGSMGTSTIERYMDGFGRQTGYALDGVRQTTVGYDSASGRVSSMLVGGEGMPFTWSYLPNSSLKSSLAYPNGLLASWQYDAKNQLLRVRNAAVESAVSQYDYTYDAIGRRVAISRSGSAMLEARTDIYGYNARNELVSASNAGVPAAPEYSYSYDGIGNRLTSSELVAGGDEFVSSAYAANNLNQYTSISNSVSSTSPCEPFLPQFDADGNQTVVKTSTGVWTVEYNGENRPVLWTCGETNIVMSYDRLGRRAQSIVLVGSSTNRIDAFAYNGYLLVARRRVALGGEAATDTFVWDVTEPIATSPLVYCRAGTQPSYYTHDGNKNVSELMPAGNSIYAHYEYAPFGVETASSGDFGIVHGNPFRFSSEYTDDTLGLVHYNYRSYNPQDGRWLSRDPFTESPDVNGYLMCRNYAGGLIDVLGLWWTSEHKKMTKEVLGEIRASLPCLANKKTYDKVVNKIVDGNAEMDDMTKEYADNLPLHFNRGMNQEVNEAKELYKKGLEERRTDINNDLFPKDKNVFYPTIEQCDDALKQMGQLTHMLQDYYGHGVGDDYKFIRDVYVPVRGISTGYSDFSSSMWFGESAQTVRVPVWEGEIGAYSGSPDAPAEEQMKPSSYAAPGLGSEHGGLLDGEPAWRAPDKKERRQASKKITADELMRYMGTWCEKCCPQRYETLLTIPSPSPSMADVMNAMTLLY